MTAKETLQLSKKKSAPEESTHKKSHWKRKLFILALFALAGYYYGFQLDEEKRSRVSKLLFEGREMWFRLFV
jgi:hypothetical protein